MSGRFFGVFLSVIFFILMTLSVSEVFAQVAPQPTEQQPTGARPAYPYPYGYYDPAQDNPTPAPEGGQPAGYGYYDPAQDNPAAPSPQGAPAYPPQAYPHYDAAADNPDPAHLANAPIDHATQTDPAEEQSLDDITRPRDAGFAEKPFTAE